MKKKTTYISSCTDGTVTFYELKQKGNKFDETTYVLSYSKYEQLIADSYKEKPIMKIIDDGNGLEVVREDGSLLARLEYHEAEELRMLLNHYDNDQRYPTKVKKFK
jgi:hypothetical protein